MEDQLLKIKELEPHAELQGCQKIRLESREEENLRLDSRALHDRTSGGRAEDQYARQESRESLRLESRGTSAWNAKVDYLRAGGRSVDQYPRLESRGSEHKV